VISTETRTSALKAANATICGAVLDVSAVLHIGVHRQRSETVEHERVLVPTDGPAAAIDARNPHYRSVGYERTGHSGPPTWKGWWPGPQPAALPVSLAA